MNGYLLPGVDTDVGTGLPQIAGTRFQRVFDELRHNCCAADELTLFLLLGMTTFACQDGAFVRLRNGTLSPLTGYFIVSAPPASGKSTVLTRLSQPFGQAEIEAKEGGAQLRRHYRAKRIVWRSQVRQLTREIDEAIAAELGFWLAQETSRVISRSKEPSAADKQDIDILVHMLRVHVLRYRRPFVARRELSDMAPGFGLDEARCKRALHALCQAHWVSLDSRGSAKFIRLSPQYFPGC